MSNPWEKIGGSFEPDPINNRTEAEEDAADKAARRNRLNGLQQRRTDLEEWAKSWTPDDRRLADQLDGQIAQLKKDLGE